MAANFDLFLQDNDLLIDGQAGDFLIAVSDDQHIMDNIAAFPGWWKEDPADGVGVFAYQNSSGQLQVLGRIVKQQLQADGYQCNNPLITQSPDGELILQPNAIKS